MSTREYASFNRMSLLSTRRTVHLFFAIIQRRFLSPEPRVSCYHDLFYFICLLDLLLLSCRFFYTIAHRQLARHFFFPHFYPNFRYGFSKRHTTRSIDNGTPLRNVTVPMNLMPLSRVGSSRSFAFEWSSKTQQQQRRGAVIMVDAVRTFASCRPIGLVAFGTSRDLVVSKPRVLLAPYQTEHFASTLFLASTENERAL